MKKPLVDYRQFRPGKLNDPEFAHLKLLGGWIVYFAMYFVTENLIPAGACHVMHCTLDDIIPFNEFFAIFYVSWYFLTFGSLLYFVLYDIRSFSNLQKFIMVTQAVAVIIYIVYPSRQDLRPESFERENVLTALMGAIYAFDTSTGVCPSLHVAFSLGIASVWLKRKESTKLWRGTVCIWAFLICISTAFVKQHSVLDILAALPVGLLAEMIVYAPEIKKRRALLRSHGKG